MPKSRYGFVCLYFVSQWWSVCWWTEEDVEDVAVGTVKIANPILVFNQNW